MSGWEIFWAIVVLVIAIIVIMNFSDLMRYMRIRRM